ncbi:hypothetical protein GCM10029992_50570 [Glycomyces albus]
MQVQAHSEHTAAAVTALRRLDRTGDAQALRDDLGRYVDRQERTEARIDYFATSLPTMLLFTADPQAAHATRNLVLRAQLAQLDDEPDRAAALAELALDRDPLNGAARAVVESASAPWTLPAVLKESHDEPDTRPRTARRRTPPPRRGHLLFGESPGALDRIEVTGRWIERAGRPWIPITGEIHYSRLTRERWDEILGHARAGGLDSIATYVFWAAHEPEPGRFDWTGNLDLRAFVELAGSHGLDVVVRLGPWGHGEYRNGASPTGSPTAT